LESRIETLFARGMQALRAFAAKKTLAVLRRRAHIPFTAYTAGRLRQAPLTSMP
jgi:hypothetical protein